MLPFEVRHLIGHTAACTSIQSQYLGNRLWSGSEDGTIRCWDLTTCKEVSRSDVEKSIKQIVLLHHGELIAFVSDEDWTVTLCTASGKMLRTTGGAELPFACIAGSLDSDCLFLGGFDGTIRCCSIDSFQPLWEVKLAPHAVSSLATCSRLSLVATGWPDGYITVLNANEGQLITQLSGHVGKVRSLAFSPTEDVLLTSGTGDTSVYLWSTVTWEQVDDRPQHNGPIACTTFSPCGRFAASGDYTGLACIWNIQSKTELRTLQIPGDGFGIQSLQFDSTANHLVTASSLPVPLRIWDSGCVAVSS